MNIKALHSIVNTPAWNEVEQIIRDEVYEGKKALNFKTEGKTVEMIALECMARDKAANIVDRALKKIKRLANSDVKVAPQSWK